MLDTGILQYLEDTEKFYPNKKITKQELEDLYDTSPLGNLEVRVKETLTYRKPHLMMVSFLQIKVDQNTETQVMLELMNKQMITLKLLLMCQPYQVKKERLLIQVILKNLTF